MGALGLEAVFVGDVVDGVSLSVGSHERVRSLSDDWRFVSCSADAAGFLLGDVIFGFETEKKGLELEFESHGITKRK